MYTIPPYTLIAQKQNQIDLEELFMGSARYQVALQAPGR